MSKFLDRLKREFAWENNEYDIPEETLVHPEIDVAFPGILMNGDAEEHNLGLDDHDDTDVELIRKVSQTTGMPAHGTGLTGVRDVVNANNDPTIIVLQQNVGD